MRLKSFRNIKLAALVPVAAAVAIGVSACGEINHNKADGPTTTSWKAVPMSETPVLPPPKGAVQPVGARAHYDQAGYNTWVIVFPGASDIPGENRMTLDVVPTNDDPLAILDHHTRPFSGPLYTPATLAAKIDAEFPGARGEASSVGRRDRYGIYDFALTRRGDDTCVLAWQMIDDKVRILPASIDKIRIEWRMCARRGTPDSLLEPLDKLNLAPNLGILPAARDSK